MPEVQYVLCNRLHAADHEQGMDAMADTLEVIREHADILHDSQDHDQLSFRRTLCFGTESDFIKALSKDSDPLLLVEPRCEFRSHGAALSMIAGGRYYPAPAPTSDDHKIRIRVFGKDKRGSMQPLENADATLMYADPKGDKHLLPLVYTDANGECELKYDEGCTPLVVASYPQHGFWSAFKYTSGEDVVLECEPLPMEGPTDWWHRFLGVEHYEPDAGQGARIGIIGSGVSYHPNLDHIQRVDGKSDISSHGTAVCGLIAARPRLEGEYAGVAPGAEILTQRVFEKQPNGKVKMRDQSVLAHAIDLFAHPNSPYQVDLINLSLGAASGSQIVIDSIRHAYQAGTLCVCSAGNDSGDVEFPAQMKETVAVSGLGLEDWGPDNSVTVFMKPHESQTDRFGDDGLFFANFSNFGIEISCGGPANGVISTVSPSKSAPSPYGVMDGTSLSSPLVCALMARLLARTPEIQGLSGTDRCVGMIAAMKQYCRDIGLQRKFGGQGMPELSARPIRSSSV